MHTRLYSVWKCLLECLLSTLIIYNEGNKSTLFNKIREKFIDMMICNMLVIYNEMVKIFDC